MTLSAKKIFFLHTKVILIVSRKDLNEFYKTQTKLFTTYSHLSNKRGGWNKRGGGAKVAKSLNVEVGINVEGGIFRKKTIT